MKIRDVVLLGDFAATMKAITYPEEFEVLEGVGNLRQGLQVGDQPPQSFGLCYRTMVGNDLAGADVEYKIHVLYNVTAIPSDKAYASVSNDPSLVEFEWSIVAVPEELPGFRPTAHFIINTKKLDPLLLEDIEEKLYGSTTAEASLIPMTELVTFINEWYRVKIIDNGDGSWTAIADRDGFIFFLDGGLESMFQIVGVKAVYLDAETYQISDTTDVSDVPQIRIDYLPDGSWSATTEQDGLIFDNGDGTFTILNANATPIDAESYSLSDTTDLD